jgi:predicted anti-sigma-YlaC factor YlaD
MGPVSDVSCEKWREAIAMNLFGDLSANEAAGLAAHLEGCADCRAVAGEFAETYRMLGFVDPTNVTPTASVPPELTDRVLRGLHEGGRHLRRRQQVRASVIGISVAAAAALALVVVFGLHSTPPAQRTLALRGTPTVNATAVLSARSWGTALALHERGLPGGSVYTVSMETANGYWWVAGTYRSVSGRAVDATMSCAVKLNKITGLRVTNSAGDVVLSSDDVNPAG